MLFNFFNNLFYLIIFILFTFSIEVIYIKNDTPAVFNNNNNNFFIKYTIKEIDKAGIKNIINNTESTDDDEYYFCINHNGKIRKFKIKRTFGLEKDGIVHCNNKKFTLFLYFNSKYDYIKFKFDSSYENNSGYNFVFNKNTTYCICVKNLEYLDRVNITSLLHIVQYNANLGNKQKVVKYFKDNFYSNSNTQLKYLFLKGKQYTYKNVKVEKNKEDKLWHNILRNSNRHCLFAINRGEFRNFLNNPDYFVGKKYKCSTKAYFLGQKVDIILSECYLREVDNKKIIKNKSKVYHSKEKIIKKTNSSLDNAKTEDNSDNNENESNLDKNKKSR
ncbi:hypothetical protein EHP00_866 [Ecytonucleospora hepatopenaei]|uniref:Uncharacterized protein n=1 Tax=Ecytonucleospora hepatopenaei TaxID=646526 RepID=A0A1W0E414_9MICR|nr:hypothetical protein EHP00_866 [Ecytonucleospora hepatopenaei]